MTTISVRRLRDVFAVAALTCVFLADSVVDSEPFAAFSRAVALAAMLYVFRGIREDLGWAYPVMVTLAAAGALYCLYDAVRLLCV